jgi:uncharacterized membrane-anchored protein YhcB (DUF1043 family)
MYQEDEETEMIAFVVGFVIGVVIMVAYDRVMSRSQYRKGD